MTEQVTKGYPYAKFYSAMSRLYLAEVCLEAGESACFVESTDFLLERETVMRSRSRYHAATEGVTWSSIKHEWFDKYAHSYFEDELARTMMDDPRGTDFRARIDYVLTIAEERTF